MKLVYIINPSQITWYDEIGLQLKNNFITEMSNFVFHTLQIPMLLFITLYSQPPDNDIKSRDRNTIFESYLLILKDNS